MRLSQHLCISFRPKLFCVVVVVLNIQCIFNTTGTEQYNLGLTKHRDVEIGVCVTN